MEEIFPHPKRNRGNSNPNDRINEKITLKTANDCRVEENPEEQLKKLLDEISKTGKSVINITKNSANESEHIECCDEVSQWALNLLMNLPRDQEWRIKIEKMVYKTLFEHINKPKSCKEIEEMLSWLKEVAKNPFSLAGSNLNDENDTSKLKKMVIYARDALFLDVVELSAEEYFSSYQTARTSSLVRVGPSFQAKIPAWTRRGSELKWLGTPVWPLPGVGTQEEIMSWEIGRGRPEFCGCPNPRSVACVRCHVAQSRVRLRLSLGAAFTDLGLSEMGEEVSGAWTLCEQRVFEALVCRGASEGRLSGRPMTQLGCKTRRELVGFYFNTLVLRRLGMQTRLHGKLADSDDDEFDLRPYEHIYPRAAYRIQEAKEFS